jgi:hypothetical protein
VVYAAKKRCASRGKIVLNGQKVENSFIQHFSSSLRKKAFCYLNLPHYNSPFSFAFTLTFNYKFLLYACQSFIFTLNKNGTQKNCIECREKLFVTCESFSKFMMQSFFNCKSEIFSQNKRRIFCSLKI